MADLIPNEVSAARSLARLCKESVSLNQIVCAHPLSKADAKWDMTRCIKYAFPSCEKFQIYSLCQEVAGKEEEEGRKERRSYVHPGGSPPQAVGMETLGLYVRRLWWKLIHSGSQGH